MQELEEQVSDLSVNNTRLKQQLTLVQAENHFLKTGGLSGVLPVDDSMFQAMLLQGGSLCPRGQNNDFNQEGPRYRDPNGPVQPLCKPTHCYPSIASSHTHLKRKGMQQCANMSQGKLEELTSPKQPTTS